MSDLGKVKGKNIMPRSIIYLSLVATLAISGCKQAEAPTEKPATTETDTASAPAAIAEPGSGTYAADCKAKDKGYAIALTNDSSNMVVAEVTHAGKTLSNQLTSYSFMGDATPKDFLITVLFEEGKAPDGVNAKEGRIELWKDGTSFYALVDGDKAKKLSLCAA
jgi:hypothetical protein